MAYMRNIALSADDKYRECSILGKSIAVDLVRSGKPRNRKEICDYLGLTSTTYAIQTYVMPLVERGLIKLSIPDKPKSSKQLL